MNIKKILRHAIPSPFLQNISWQRTHARSLTRHLQFSRVSRDLEWQLLRGCQLVPTRNDLLDQMPKRLVCAEVGVAHGDFSREIINRLRPSLLILIDAWGEVSGRYGNARLTVESELAPEIATGQVVLNQGWSWEVLSSLKDASLDWVYIDAAHDYESVHRDLLAAQSKVRKDGWICGHDYTSWSSKGINRWGVVEAVNDFCRSEGWRFEILSHETHRHVSYALRRLEAR
jgi:hypothetical protein